MICRPSSIATPSSILTPEQWSTYECAENDGVIQLEALEKQLTIQHVFELVLRLKQICNFDPATGKQRKTGSLGRRHGRGFRERQKGDRV